MSEPRRFLDGHIVDVSRGADRRALPEVVGTGRAPQPDGTISYETFKRILADLAANVRPTKRRKNMMSMLATGWLPWGVRWDKRDGFANLPLCGARYVMSCGHVMRAREAQLFVDHGLLQAGALDSFKRPTLVITRAGRDWLSWVW